MRPVLLPTAPSLNKAPLYLVCVLSKVKGESSDVNIQFFCVRVDYWDKKKGDPGKTRTGALTQAEEGRRDRLGPWREQREEGEAEASPRPAHRPGRLLRTSRQTSAASQSNTRHRRNTHEDTKTPRGAHAKTTTGRDGGTGGGRAHRVGGAGGSCLGCCAADPKRAFQSTKSVTIFGPAELV